MPRHIQIPTAEEISEVVQQVGPSDPVLQLQFIVELAKDKAKVDNFLNDPAQFIVRNNIVLDPVIVKYVTDYVLFDPLVPMPDDPSQPQPDPGQPRPDIPRVAPYYPPEAWTSLQNQLESLSSQVNPHAWPAAVAALAAVVAAGAAVATAVCSCSSNQELLNSLSSIDPQGFDGLE